MFLRSTKFTRLCAKLENREILEILKLLKLLKFLKLEILEILEIFREIVNQNLEKNCPKRGKI